MTRDFFEVQTGYDSYFRGASGGGFDDRLRQAGLDPLTCRERSTVVRRVLHNKHGGPGLDVFVKVYAYCDYPWQRLWRRGRVAVELDGLREFARLGFMHTEPLAWGWQRSWLGRLQKECLITRAVPGAQALEHWFPPPAERDSDRETERQRRQLLRKLAQQLRCLHAAGYFHRDLRWRNVMVAPGADGAGEPVWLDSPRGFRRWIRLGDGARRIRDLATMERVAVQRCRLRERVEFLRVYLGCAPGDQALRRWWTRIGRYARWRRWYHR